MRFGGPAALGQTLLLELASPTDRASDYLLLLSIATTPPILLPDGRTVPLQDTSLLLMPGNGFPFADGVGVLDGSGSAFPRLAIPQVPALTGLTLVFAFVEIDPRASLSIGSISEPSWRSRPGTSRTRWSGTSRCGFTQKNELP